MFTSNQSAIAPSVDLARHPAAIRQLKVLAVVSVLLVACFSRPLYSLIQFALQSTLYSHIVLIPFISVYLVWLQRKDSAFTQPRHREFALLPLIIGIGLLIGYWTALSGTNFARQDHLSLMITTFLCLFFSAYLFIFGAENFRPITFPLALLIFIVPFPMQFEHAIESFLQRGSASAACALLRFSGMPVFKQRMELHLPGFNMQVAPECSGIHSSLVLFITSLIAGRLLMRTNWARAVFVLAVIPLAMLRNGFRIFVLGELCVQVDPAWINSDLHHRGGPIFFVLSLIPFFLLLLLLRKFESKNKTGSH